MKLVEPGAPISIDDLRQMAAGGFGDLVKAAVDVGKGVMVVDAELHSDQEAFLLDQGSRQSDLWGVNLYPGLSGPDFIESDSMINVRPAQGNRSRGVGDEALRAPFTTLVEGLVSR